MKHAPMRFCGLSLSHNPHTLSISDSVNIRKLEFPFTEPDSEALGLRLRVVSGEGEFCGDDCMDRYTALERLLRAHRSGRLMLPESQPMYAVLSELELTAPPLDGVVRYRFKFTQAQSPRRERSGAEYYVTAEEGESLWDICFYFNADISRTVGLNPQIAYIDSLKKGERVRLC